jgi:hypothetical protein
MPMVATVFIRTRRTPSPQIRARDTSLDGTANGSAGVNSAPDLGGERCRDHEDRGDTTNYRKLAEHNLSLPWAQITELPLGRAYELVRVSENDFILEPLTGPVATMAAMNKCLAQSNKSLGRYKATINTANDGYSNEKMCPMSRKARIGCPLP